MWEGQPTDDDTAVEYSRWGVWCWPGTYSVDKVVYKAKVLTVVEGE